MSKLSGAQVNSPSVNPPSYFPPMSFAAGNDLSLVSPLSGMENTQETGAKCPATARIFHVLRGRNAAHVLAANSISP